MTNRTALCIALLSESLSLREHLAVSTRELIAPDDAARFLSRRLLRHALGRTDLLSMRLGSHLAVVEGELSILEANLRTRERLQRMLDTTLLTYEKSESIKRELSSTVRRLAAVEAKAKDDLEELDDLLFLEMSVKARTGPSAESIAHAGSVVSARMQSRRARQRKEAARE